MMLAIFYIGVVSEPMEFLKCIFVMESSISDSGLWNKLQELEKNGFVEDRRKINFVKKSYLTTKN